MPPSIPQPPPPPPAPLPLSSKNVAATTPAPKPPNVTPTGPPGAFLVELLIFNGFPFKDHWAYWMSSRGNPNVGTKVHATGDVRNGFKLEAQRSLDFDLESYRPTTRIPLQWVDGEYFDEKAMFNNGILKFDDRPVCAFEASAYKVEAPAKSLNAASDSDSSGKKITQRDCQTWIVESADQLARDGIFSSEVVSYLLAIKQ
ncbi:hypothetical protein NPX13_g6593 [Xylaria arbuscula]|uniref:Uncharacterized protein n=1 Tax=Xylaria arbuscula TaxID=114810 RepID=A0A9W8NBJ9_9PEZI|nr:hypothetical protein NPX13_g6593 [Xylaria arbuscula]